MNQIITSFLQRESTKTVLLRGLALWKVPLLGICAPSVIESTKERCVVKMPLTWLSKNHVGSMYFGALAMGAELSIAHPVATEVFEKKRPLNFLFTEFSCQFLKKAKEDIYFVFEDIAHIQNLMDQVEKSGESKRSTFQGRAFLASLWQQELEPVATYTLGISLKKTR